jgi:hypothetical protein
MQLNSDCKILMFQTSLFAQKQPAWYNRKPLLTGAESLLKDYCLNHFFSGSETFFDTSK